MNDALLSIQSNFSCKNVALDGHSHWLTFTAFTCGSL